jgi:hypothetical protein
MLQYIDSSKTDCALVSDSVEFRIMMPGGSEQLVHL